MYSDNLTECFRNSCFRSCMKLLMVHQCDTKYQQSNIQCQTFDMAFLTLHYVSVDNLVCEEHFFGGIKAITRFVVPPGIIIVLFCTCVMHVVNLFKQFPHCICLPCPLNHYVSLSFEVLFKQKMHVWCNVALLVPCMTPPRLKRV